MQTSALYPANAPSGLAAQTYERLFGEQYQQFDLREGTVANLTGSRVIYMSADIIRGIYEALHYEAGEAWSVILKSCGQYWGQRTATLLTRELRNLLDRPLEQLTVNEFVDLLETYFAMHGWGRIKVRLDTARSHGIIRVTMTHSLFADALGHVEGQVDFLAAGMLKSLFETISGQTLDCIEIGGSRTPIPTTEFLISGPERMALLADVAADLTVDEALARLKEG